MTKIEEIYPDANRYGYASFGDYQPMLDSFGPIVLQVDDNDYQGDSRVLYKKGRKWGILIFGWGCCSGCDALLACNSYEEAEQLRQQLESDVKWAGKRDSLKWLKDEEARESEYSWHAEETRKFYREAIELIEAS